MVTATLDGMAAGGFYDVVGGGFHRYSVDDRWLVPHFEKMLYDNAAPRLDVPPRLGRHRARRATARSSRRRSTTCCASSRSRAAALASAQDADTDGVEGLTYTWTPEEAAAVGLPRELLEPFEHGRLDRARRARPGAPRTRARRAATRGRSRSATTRRSPRGTGSRSRRSPRRATGSSATTGSTRRARARRVPARPAVRRRRAPPALDPRRPHERLRLPRRLRERRATG